MFTSHVAEAALSLKEGAVLAYPTEAVWGLGCDPFNEAAFNHILNLKQRPIEKGVILLASSIQQISHFLNDLPDDIQQQVIASWSKQETIERATTWLLPTHPSIPHWITGNHSSVAVRVTHHPLCYALCEKFGGFIVSTSANPAGLTPAKSQEDAYFYFGDQVTYLEGELGRSKEPSKIIDAISGKVIRP